MGHSQLLQLSNSSPLLRKQSNKMLPVRTAFKILNSPKYLLLAIIASVIIFTAAIWLPNIKLILMVLSSASFSDSLRFLGSLYGSIYTNFAVVSAVYTIAISLLFGSQVAFLTYYVRRVHRQFTGVGNAGTASILGLVSGALGIGCAACGTFVLTSVLALFGTASVITFLPLGGQEFGFIGIILLLYANYSLLKKINAPLVCGI